MTIWKGAAAPLKSAAFDQVARRLGCDVGALRAVWQVEAAGREFLSDGSVIRRFEPHHFPRQSWAQIGFRPKAGEAPWRASLRIKSSAERERMLEAACRLDRRAALRAASWGGPQIMGFNHVDAGFSTIEEMVQLMADDGAAHLNGFVQLVIAWEIDGALRGHDWLAFARRYNGGGQPEVYARRIEAAYRKASGRSSPVVLRVGARGAAVRELQTALEVPVDGAFGPQTLDAVRAFQAQANLAVDGVVGAKSWAALETSRDAKLAPQPTVYPAWTVLARALAEIFGRFTKGATA